MVANGATIRPPDSARVDLDVSIVMPCLNGERTLAYCIETAQAALEQLRAEHGLEGEILIIDSGSHDQSRELARTLGARVVKYSVAGYGAVLRHGIVHARGRYVVMGDADGSYDFRESVAMVERLLQGYELCNGCRFSGRIVPEATPSMRPRTGTPLSTRLLNLIFDSGLSDVGCGLRALTRDALRRLAPSSRGVEFASEIVIKGTLLNLRRTEIPVTQHRNRQRSPSSLGAAWRHARCLLLFSPVAWSLIPGVSFFGAGVALFAARLATPLTPPFVASEAWREDPWMASSLGLVSTGHLCLLFAMASALAGLRDGYRPVTRLIRCLYAASRLARLLAPAVFLGCMGVLMFADLAVGLARGAPYSAMQALDVQRQVAVGAALVVLGVQAFLGGLLLSLVSGNEAELEEAMYAARRTSDEP
jgi:hypothetical protein